MRIQVSVIVVKVSAVGVMAVVVPGGPCELWAGLRRSSDATFFFPEMSKV